MIRVFLLSLSLLPVSCKSSEHALRFDGLGAISGGGATSKLLNTYPLPYRSDIYDYLFKPSFGASLQILKVEIGGGAQTTEGTELSHMPTSHYRDVHNLNTHSYEWKVLIEAKRRNPNIILIGLAWSFPGWLSNGTQNPFLHPELFSKYLITWLDVAKSFNLKIDYLGIWNEPPDSSFDDIATCTKYLRKTLDYSVDYKHVKLIVGDERGWGIAEKLMSDKDFYNSVEVLSSHYPGEVGYSGSGKTLWASEDYSTVNTGQGAACLARVINRNYVNGGMTSTIAWNLVSSYYDSLPYPNSGLMNANQPWTGYYSVQPPIWVMAHTTQFTKPGWLVRKKHYGSGELFGGSYVTYISPDGRDITIVIETMTHKLSECIRPKTPTYVTKIEDFVMNITTFIDRPVSSLNYWESHIDKQVNKCSMMKKMPNLEVVGGNLSLFSIQPDTLITLTTINGGGKSKPSAHVPIAKPFPLNYTNDFEPGPEAEFGDEPVYLTPQVGTFQLARVANRSSVLMQTTYTPPVEFCGPSKPNTKFPPKLSPVALMLFDSTAYQVEANVSIDIAITDSPLSPTAGVFVALFMEQGGCFVTKSAGIFFVLNSTGICSIYDKFNFTSGTELIATECAFKPGTFFKAHIFIRGNSIRFYLDGDLVLETLKRKSMYGGFLGLGCTGFYKCMFDNLEIFGF